MNSQFRMSGWGKASTVALCAAVAVSLGGSAFAQGCDSRIGSPYADPSIHPVFGEDARYATVTYSDLDLASPVGARTMLQRLERATAIVCGPKPFVGDWNWTLWNYCVDTRMDQVLTRLGSPTVAAAYAEERASWRVERACP